MKVLVLNCGSSSVSRLPLISFITMDIGTLVGNHQFEIAFL